MAGESLASFVNRVSIQIGIRLPVFLDALGVMMGRNTDRRIKALRETELSSADQKRLATALGLPIETFADMHSEAEELLDRVRGLRTWGPGLRHLLWRTGAAPICPECLAENDGARLLIWRTLQCFVCPKHRRLLISLCPSCQRAIPIGFGARVAHPAVCGAAIPAGSTRATRAICQFDLREAAREPPLPKGPILDAGTYLHSVLTEATPRDSRETMADYRAVSIGLLNALDSNAIAARAGLPDDAVKGLTLDDSYPMLSPEDEVLYCAAVLTSADRILRSPDPVERTSLLRPLVALADPAPSVQRETVRTRLWGEHSARFDEFLVHVLDEELPIVDRLRFGTSTTRPIRPTAATDLEADYRAHKLPAMFWPELTYLVADEASSEVALRRALSVATVLIGQESPNVGRAAERLGTTGAAVDLTVLGEGTRRTAVVRWITELASDVSSHPRAISYGVRRQLDYGRTLPRRSWPDVHNGLAPSGSEAMRRAAQLFIARRISGDWAPNGLREQPTPAEYDRYLLAMNQTRLAYIDLYSEHILGTHWRQEPIVELPPIDTTALLVEGIGDQQRHGIELAIRDGAHHVTQVAQALGLSPLRVRLILQCNPPGVHEGHPITWRRGTYLPSLTRPRGGGQ